MNRARTTIPSKPDDARVRRSIDALSEAFLALIAKKALVQITIKEITEEAGLSYPTFFRRFSSKEELLEQIAEEEVRNLLRLGHADMGHDPVNSLGRRICEYVQAHRSLWSVLLTGGAAAAMREEFIRVAEKITESQQRLNPWIPGDLGPAFVASGIFEIFAWWMRQPDDYPLDNVVALFNHLIVENTGRRRKVQLPVVAES